MQFVCVCVRVCEMCQKHQTVQIFLNKYLIYPHEMWPVGSLLYPLHDNHTELILHNELFEYNEGKCILASVPVK